MALKAIRKLSFIGGSLRPVGTVVNFPDEKLVPRTARSAPGPDGRDDNVRVANSNLIDPGEARTLAIAPQAAIAPTGPNPTMPQQVPAGAYQGPGGHYDGATLLVAEGSEAAANPPTGTTTTDVIEEEGRESAFDHDGDGNDGGSAPNDPPSLSGKNKAELTQIAADEEVTFDEGATNAQIVEAIEAKRAAPAE